MTTTLHSPSLSSAMGVRSVFGLLTEGAGSSLLFTVPFKPQSKNHRIPTRSGKVRKPKHVDAAQRTFENLAVQARPSSCPWQGPVFVELLCVLPIAKSWKDEKKSRAAELLFFPICTPDVDNLAKLPMDAMTKARIWGDDAQVVGLLIVKVYGDSPRTEVRVWEISNGV